MSPELRTMLIEVISSWQVIAVTVALIIYFFIFSKVFGFHGGAKKSSPASPKVKGGSKKAAATAVPEPSDSDDLGLEEE